MVKCDDVLCVQCLMHSRADAGTPNALYGMLLDTYQELSRIISPLQNACRDTLNSNCRSVQTSDANEYELSLARHVLGTRLGSFQDPQSNRPELLAH
jgi:hypothetical protein